MIKAANFTRRSLFALSLGAAVALNASGAAALSTSEAETFVTGVVGDLRGLIQDNRTGAEGAADFLQLLDRTGSVSDVARFAAGRSWRDMSGAQQSAYHDAFRGYISRTYQKRFSEYAGEDIVVTGSTDAGSRGVLVDSTLKRPNAPSVLVEWLVSDRGSGPRVDDVIFEGVSLAITLRETFGGMIDSRDGDIDQFIADLRSSAGA